MQSSQMSLLYDCFNHTACRKISNALASRDPHAYYAAVNEFHPHSPTDIEDAELYEQGRLVHEQEISTENEHCKNRTSNPPKSVNYDSIASALFRYWDSGYLSKRELITRLSTIRKAGYPIDQGIRKMSPRMLFGYFCRLRRELGKTARERCSPTLLEKLADEEKRSKDPFFAD